VRTFVLGKLARALVTLVLVTIVMFILSRASGDAVRLAAPPDASPEDLALVRERLGLDQPLVLQYVRFLGDALRGDLGSSIKYSTDNLPLIMDRFPNTLSLALAAIVIALVVSIPIGILAAYRPGGLVDRVARLGALAGQSVPTFVVGLLLVLVFSLQLQLLPSGNQRGPASYVLPALTLAWFAMAAITRITRASMLETLSSTYVTAARAKGIPEGVILVKHALRNAGTAILTMTALQFVLLANGAIVVESIFNWPGIGSLTVDAAFSRDYPLLQALVIFTAALTITVGLLTDIAYKLIDRRIDHGTG
jgi:peptide/nickel transport system permease protein